MLLLIFYKTNHFLFLRLFDTENMNAPIACEITEGSIHRIINLMKVDMGFDSSSKFIHVDSGFRKSHLAGM